MELTNTTNTFYLTELEAGRDNDIMTASISTKKHGGCIEVHGSGIELLHRVEKILNVLNTKDQ